MTTALGEKIKAIIRTTGPISVTDFFSLCLADPEHGYYRTRQPFGRAGDFVTAPEISQLFGEMLGIFLVHAWQRHDRPPYVRLAEIGPGRGTMMSDMLRVISKVEPSLYEAMSIHMIETSDRLKAVQAETLKAHHDKIYWHDGFDDVPAGFILLAANELFDAIPIRQFVKTTTGFRERMIALDADDALMFTVGIAGIDPSLLPVPAHNVPVGTIFEISPARQAVMMTICERLRDSGGSAVIIDYGHLVSGFGDTLQAVLKHDYDDPLAHPGEADLTSHVDFQSLAETAVDCGVQVNGAVMQGDFLFGLGITERAGSLGREKDEAARSAIRSAVERLAGEGMGRMGALFKVLAVSSPEVSLLPFRPVD